VRRPHYGASELSIPSGQTKIFCLSKSARCQLLSTSLETKPRETAFIDSGGHIIMAAEIMAAELACPNGSAVCRRFGGFEKIAIKANASVTKLATLGLMPAASFSRAQFALQPIPYHRALHWIGLTTIAQRKVR
jgi:hypothetical protein